MIDEEYNQIFFSVYLFAIPCCARHWCAGGQCFGSFVDYDGGGGVGCFFLLLIVTVLISRDFLSSSLVDGCLFVAASGDIARETGGGQRQ